MGIGRSFAEAFAKAMLASGARIPQPGTAFLSVREADKAAVIDLARELDSRGFNLVATGGTAKVIREGGVACQRGTNYDWKQRRNRMYICNLPF